MMVPIEPSSVHVEHVDDRIDLAKLLEQAEQQRADPGAEDAAGDQHAAHLVIHAAAPAYGRSTPETLAP
jgi:hypothetical protein